MSLVGLKEFSDFIKKHGWKKGSAILAVFLLLGGGYKLGETTACNQTVTTTAKASVGDINLFPVEPSTTEKKGDGKSDAGSCPEKIFEENKDQWILKEYSGPDQDGFYCPKNSSGFPSPDMWLDEPISLGTKSVSVTVESKPQRSNTATTPALILSLGSSPRISRFYLGEVSPQVVGFERLDLNSKTKKLERDVTKELDDPLQAGTQTEITFRPVNVNGNSENFYFDVLYISDQTHKQLSDTFSYDLILPFPKPSETQVRFGIGTFKGSCIKPIKYKICD